MKKLLFVLGTLALIVTTTSCSADSPQDNKNQNQLSASTVGTTGIDEKDLTH